MNLGDVADAVSRATIGSTFNFYRDGEGAERRRDRLRAYLDERADAPLALVAEAPGHRGTRVSGIPLTSERQLTGTGPAEATATIVHRVLAELCLADDVLLWNVVPTHPHARGRPESNRRPTKDEIAASRRFVAAVAAGRSVVAVGRLAETRLELPSNSLLLGSVRHPSHGGAAEFRAGLRRIVRAEANGKERPMDEATVREHAEAHAQAMENGDLDRAGRDVAREFWPHLGEIMSQMPRPVTRAEVLSVQPAGDDEFFSEIRYSGEGKETTLQARWADRGGRPQIVDIQVV